MLKVVVVDDSLILRRNVNKMLTEMGHKVVSEAKDGVEAISCFKKFEPDFLTMDITMPDMNGIEATQEIRKINKSAKIIMVTSHGQEDMVKDAIRAGASGYVLKPVSPLNLSKAIEKIFPQLAQKESQELDIESKNQNSEYDDLKLDDE